MLFDTLQSQVLAALKPLLPSSESELALETPPNPEMGDFAFPTFKLAKAFRKSPQAISAELRTSLQANPELSKTFQIEALGPYVNFSVRPEVLKGTVLKSLLLSANELGQKQAPGEKPTVVLEFSSPNVAKAFNIYHLRGTMIGNCLYRVYKARGFSPVAINHLGDWGTQYGTLALAYQMWGNDQEFEKRGIEYLVELYIRINKEKEADPGLADQARALFAKLEQGDTKIRALWQKFVDLSLKEFRRTYERLNVEFDHYLGESFYVDKVDAVSKELESKALLVESEGAVIVDLEAFGMPPCIFRKKDGSTLYATRDLAAAIYRKQKWDFSKMVYVVGGEQKLHFAQVFKVLELMGHKWADSCVHVDFGLYRFGDAESGFQKMSTRKGTFVTMDSVLDHAVERVSEKIAQKGIITDENERARVAETVGVGAIIFNDLSTDRNNNVNFELEQVLDFEGETGPYVQYAHTRCLGILRNAPEALREGIDPEKLPDLALRQPGFDVLAQRAMERLSEPEELGLLRTCARLPIVLDQVLDQSKPNLLANYLIDVTKAFNLFYRSHKVLCDDDALSKARLALVLIAQRTLLKGLQLLGMKAPSRM
jgi:arginyl-tRNA synthetase